MLGGRGRETGKTPRVLVVGYNGANNTGAEALLTADLADLRAVLGPDALITVPALSEENLRRYLVESPTLKITRMPTLFLAKARRLVREHDLVVLVEGSTFMDTWGSALLYYFLWTAHSARAEGKPCLAYAVDVGSLSSRNQRLVGHVGKEIDLVVTRAQAAAERLRTCGVTAPVEVTADNALTFVPDPADEGFLQRAWPEAGKGVVGIAAVDFYLWPAVFRLWGRKEDRYKWPYSFSRSPERRRATAALAATFAELADGLVEEGRPVALICMEEVDEPLAREVHRRMRRPEGARVFSSREHNASRMTQLLRSLDLLVTSRYHAAILSLAAAVPQLAVGHDLRLESLYEEIGLRERYFLDPSSPDLGRELAERTRALLADPGPARALLRQGHEALLARAQRNRDILRSFLLERGWGVG
jgi:polysaccharide pyruvyl transferase WcaK-like protein